VEKIRKNNYLVTDFLGIEAVKRRGGLLMRKSEINFRNLRIYFNFEVLAKEMLILIQSTPSLFFEKK